MEGGQGGWADRQTKNGQLARWTDIHVGDKADRSRDAQIIRESIYLPRLERNCGELEASEDEGTSSLAFLLALDLAQHIILWCT